ncbi:MAG: hypothetical protein HKP02_10870 [Xanthomonadales bacterium]|nr:hypothetical protein [Xanthomonadales bacterium]
MLQVAQAQEDRYRVEILVLTHLHHAEEPRETPFVNDYSDALDFLAPEEEEDDEAFEDDDGSESVDAAPDDIAAKPLGEEDAEPAEVAANAVFPVEDMSEVMAEAWRRLRLSAPFRPEQYLSWEQGSQPPFPALRVHDQEAVWVDDPWADVRAALAELPDLDPGVFGVAPGATDDVSKDSSSEQPLPEPTVYYRLDGKVTLRRTRFLHLDLDLQLREAVFDQSAAPITPLQEPGLQGEPPPPPKPDAYLAFGLQQSRQVKTGRMEYFDSPVLGVLAYISIVEPDASAETAPEAP